LVIVTSKSTVNSHLCGATELSTNIMLWYFIFFCLGFVFHKILPDIKHRSFAWFINRFNEQMDSKMLAFKEYALKDIKNMKAQGSIKILEIGVGTGTNFQWYPDGCHLTVIDPNPHFKSYYDGNRSKFPNIKSEEIIVGFGEEMNMVEDNSMDVVVITLVLCSVNDVKKVLEQTKRVLVPGGKLFFMEHVRDWDASHSKKQMIQDALTVSGIWPTLLDGCCLNREIHNDINEAGFSEVNMEKKYAPIDHPILSIIDPMIVGTATK